MQQIFAYNHGFILHEKSQDFHYWKGWKSPPPAKNLLIPPPHLDTPPPNRLPSTKFLSPPSKVNPPLNNNFQVIAQ